MKAEEHPNGRVLRGLAPDWIARGFTVTAWLNAEGVLEAAEVLTCWGTSRAVKHDSALWRYCQRQGRLAAGHGIFSPTDTD